MKFLSSLVVILTLAVSAISSPLTKRTMESAIEEMSKEEFEQLANWALRNPDIGAADNLFLDAQQHSLPLLSRKARAKAAKKAVAAAASRDPVSATPNLQVSEEETWTTIPASGKRFSKKQKDLDAKKTPSSARASSGVTFVPSGKGVEFLKKMGWKEGEGIGRNGQGIVEPILPEPRLPSDKRGVGFTGPMPEAKRPKKGNNRFAALEEEKGKPMDLSIPLHERFVKSDQVVGGDRDSVTMVQEALSALTLDHSGANKREATAAL
jgi:hypothetical protein